MFSIVIVVGIVMILIYSSLDKTLIFANDANYTKVNGNTRTAYMQKQWEQYGYLDYVPYAEWLRSQLYDGEISQEDYAIAVKFGDKAEKDTELAA